MAIFQNCWCGECLNSLLKNSHFGIYIYTTNMLYWIWARNFITRLVLIKWNGPLYALVLLEAQTTVTYHKFNFRPKMWLVLLEGPQTSMHSCPFRKALSPRIHVVTRLAQTLVIKPEFLPFSFFNRMDNNIFLLTSREKKKMPSCTSCYN